MENRFKIGNIVCVVDWHKQYVTASGRGEILGFKTNIPEYSLPEYFYGEDAKDFTYEVVESSIKNKSGEVLHLLASNNNRGYPASRCHIIMADIGIDIVVPETIFELNEQRQNRLNFFKTGG